MVTLFSCNEDMPDEGDLSSIPYNPVSYDPNLLLIIFQN